MTQPRLKSLVIENFRSLRGKIVIPLDAQVVLIHGTNGMGKTSVLSALELGLTGKIAHLAAAGDGYRRYLTTLDTMEGSIALATTAPSREGGATGGTLAFSDTRFTPAPLLNVGDARFFSERCYLPQATLGRLLELYDDQRTNSTSPLTLFVKELLGLDPLDALVEGLDPAFNVTRVRKIAPDFRQLETLKASLIEQISKADKGIEATIAFADDRRTRTNAMLLSIAGEDTAEQITETSDLSALRSRLSESHDQDRRLTELSRTRSELKGLLERWSSLPSEDVSRNQAEMEREDQAAVQTFADWRAAAGAPLDRAIAQARERFSDIPELDDGPDAARLEALRRAQAEESRSDALVTAHTAAAERVTSLNAIVQRATSRIEELTKDLSGAAEDAKTLANALAGIVPHIQGESCPVCDRDFGEQAAGPLSAHVAAKIASLTSEAGRLQSLATARAEESRRLATAQRDLLSAGNGQLSAEDLADHTVRKAYMSGLVSQLTELASVSAEGVRLMNEAATARQALITSRRRGELSMSMLPEIENAVQAATGQPVTGFTSIEAALREAISRSEAKSSEAERIAALRLEILSEFDRYVRERGDIARQRSERETTAENLKEVEQAFKLVDLSRAQAKKVAEAADTVRAEIVRRVFSTSLNKVWRDLFVRLAPSEQFVPAFKLPEGAGGKVEAVLETLHRSGKASGSPGAMLSQGNLNTAALTLFLALHLSVPLRMPWLVFDDPVQSMDDVHIAQFAALLRTLAKGMNRQVVIAVHERALFDYLTLELSPAFPGDSLIAVEITRNFNGDAVAMPRAFNFEIDRALAA